MKKRWATWLVLTGVVVALAGCGGNGGAGGTGGGGQTGGTAAEAIELPEIYKQNCLSCHGDQLQGRVGPKLQDVGGRLTEEQIAAIIRDGKGGMPSYGNRFNDEEISTLAAWLAEQK